MSTVGAAVPVRGRIIQYNGTDGTGVIMAGGQQYPFTIGAWRSEAVPAAGRTVEITLADGTIAAVAVVADDVLLREKASEIGGKLGAFAGRVTSQVSAQLAAARSPDGAGGGPAGAAGATPSGSAGVLSGAGPQGTGASMGIVARYGKLLLGAYAIFLIATLAFDAMRIAAYGSGMGWSLFDLAGFMARAGAGGGGSIKFLLVLAYVTCLAPLVSRNRSAWLGLVVPLIAILWAAATALHLMHEATSAAGGFVNMSNYFHIGFGFYLAFAAALVLAAGGGLKYLRGA